MSLCDAFRLVSAICYLLHLISIEPLYASWFAQTILQDLKRFDCDHNGRLFLNLEPSTIIYYHLRDSLS